MATSDGGLFNKNMKKTIFEKLLDYFNIDEKTYFTLLQKKELGDIHSFNNFKNIKECANFVLDFINNNKKILVYGDYDADGILSTSILIKAFQYLNFEAKYYIPSRYLDGYGISMENAKKIVKEGYDLVIAVDNGITLFEVISYLKENGVNVVVLDHHQIQESIPVADFILHPEYSNYGDVPTSAGYVSYMFSIALLGRIDRYLATLASISLVSDMMPLISYNRDLLKNIIDEYEPGLFKNIDYLLGGEVFDENSIGQKIAPKINAVGRIIKDTTINRLVKFFTVEDDAVILHYLEWIDSLNEERKNLTFTAKNSVNKKIEELDHNSHSISVIEDVEEGLIGLLANSIITEKKKPTIVFTINNEEEGILRGSARSLPGFNVVECFNLAKDFAITFGGHELAGGIAIYKKDYEKFVSLFEEYAKTHPCKDSFDESIELGISDFNEETYHLINTFSPFGEGWKAPLFSLNRIKSNSLTYSKNNLHIISSCGLNNRIIIFNVDKDLLNSCDYVDLFGKMKLSYFNKRKFLDFVVKNFKDSVK